MDCSIRAPEAAPEESTGPLKLSVWEYSLVVEHGLNIVLHSGVHRGSHLFSRPCVELVPMNRLRLD